MAEVSSGDLRIDGVFPQPVVYVDHNGSFTGIHYVHASRTMGKSPLTDFELALVRDKAGLLLKRPKVGSSCGSWNLIDIGPKREELSVSSSIYHVNTFLPAGEIFQETVKLPGVEEDLRDIRVIELDLRKNPNLGDIDYRTGTADLIHSLFYNPPRGHTSKRIDIFNMKKFARLHDPDFREGTEGVQVYDALDFLNSSIVTK